MTPGSPGYPPSPGTGGTADSGSCQNPETATFFGMSVETIANKALEAATRAELAAAIAKVEAEGIRTEMRERFKMVEDAFKKQDRDSADFRGWLREEFLQHRKDFSVFDTDFKEVAKQSSDHHDILHGNPQKNIPGVIPKVGFHDTWLQRMLWTWGVVSMLTTGAIGYMVFFHTEDIKRGIFNPTDDERDRAINRQVARWLPNQRWPGYTQPTPPPAPAPTP